MIRRLFLIVFVTLLSVVGFLSAVDAYRADGLFSYKESIVFDYYKRLEHNNYYPSLETNDVDGSDAIKTDRINPDYPSVYLYIDEADMPYFFHAKNDMKSIDVMGYIKTSTRGSSLESSQEVFFDTMTLRGNMSLSCAKPSFSLPGANIKLKGMCGSDFGIEEQIFSQSLERAIVQRAKKTQGPEGNDPTKTVYAPHVLHNVFVNDRFYGLYTRVPQFNSNYLIFNGYTDVSQRNSCVMKIYKLITKDLNPYGLPLLTTLETIGDYDTQDVAFLADVKYGGTGCYSKLEKLVEYVNNSALGTVGDSIDKKSVLHWGLTNWMSQTLLSYEHNYIVVIDRGRYSMGFWDNEAFHGCISRDYKKYREQSHQNLLYSHVLRRYEENDPKAIEDTMDEIEETLCNPEIYKRVKNNDLPYVLYDRYLWNIGHFTSLDFRDRSYNTLLYDVFYGQISFLEYKERMTQAFDDYFVSITP